MVSPYRWTPISITSLFNRELFGHFSVLRRFISLPGHSVKWLKSRPQKKQHEHNMYIHFRVAFITYLVTNSNYSTQALLSILKYLKPSGLLAVFFSLNFLHYMTTGPSPSPQTSPDSGWQSAGLSHPLLWISLMTLQKRDGSYMWDQGSVFSSPTTSELPSTGPSSPGT